ncbi:MAG: CorA family divalent cation transporter [Minisyncoccia bacterium]
MRQIYKGKITWVDITAPDEEDIKYLQKNYHFHPLILKELETLSQRNKAEIYDNYLFLVTHFPNWDSQKQISLPWEVDLIIAQKYLITVSYDDSSEAHLELKEKIYQKDFEHEYLSDTVKLLYFIFEHYLEFADRQITHIQTKINNIEEQIFQHKQEEVIPQLSFVKRDILNFRRIFNYLKEDLNSLNRKGKLLLGDDYKIYFDDLVGDSLKLDNVIDNFKDTLEALENTNNSFIEHKINILTRIYTIISFMTLPTILVISLYQTNTHYLPFVGSRYDTLIVLLIALTPSFLVYLYLRKKKLL